MSTLLLWICRNSETLVEEGVCKVEDTLSKGATHTNWSGCLFMFLKYKHRIPSQCLWRLLFGFLQSVVNIRTLSTVVCFSLYSYYTLFTFVFVVWVNDTQSVHGNFNTLYANYSFHFKMLFLFYQNLQTIAFSISLPYCKTWMSVKRIQIRHELLGW